jgi:hypothetical protein
MYVFYFLVFINFFFKLKIQEIKRVNKLWSDAELGLRENVYIPVNTNQLSTLRTLYPNIEIVQNLSPLTNSRQKISTNDETNYHLIKIIFQKLINKFSQQKILYNH